MDKPVRPLRRKKKITIEVSEKRSPEELGRVAACILAYLDKHPGSRAEEFQKALRITNGEALTPLQHLLADRQVFKKGYGRSARYTTAKSKKKAASPKGADSVTT